MKLDVKVRGLAERSRFKSAKLFLTQGLANDEKNGSAVRPVEKVG